MTANIGSAAKRFVTTLSILSEVDSFPADFFLQQLTYCGCIGAACFQPRFQRGDDGLVAAEGSNLLQKGKVVRFGTEGNDVGTSSSQKPNSSCGKALSTAERKGGRQLQQETYATVDGPAAPCPFVGYGGFSALSEASAHSGDDGNITKASADLLKLVAMAVVKWIVLSDYTNSTHSRSFRGISWEYSGVDNV